MHIFNYWKFQKKKKTNFEKHLRINLSNQNENLNKSLPYTVAIFKKQAVINQKKSNIGYFEMP